MSILNWLYRSPTTKVSSLPTRKLIEIEKILFPPLELNNYVSETGEVIKYHTDYCIDSALESVLTDLQDGNNDKTCQDTLNSVIKRLICIRKILGIETSFDKEAQYIKVENLDVGQNLEDIT